MYKFNSAFYSSGVSELSLAGVSAFTSVGWQVTAWSHMAGDAL